MQIPIYILPSAKGMKPPKHATQRSAGMDLCAAIPDGEVWILEPGKHQVIPTGLVLAIPTGFEGQIRPRSGLALRHGVTVLNAPGTIDADYRGEVGVILINHGETPFAIRRGDRIAQLLIAPVETWDWDSLTEAEYIALPHTTRDTGGYGSTG
jgi:dUTP pyrophosphatase